MLTRVEFVKLCNDTIVDTRKKIDVRNQVSGYKKYHKEIKENQYFKKSRKIIQKNMYSRGYDLFFQHDMAVHTGLGNCNEMADHLCVELMQALEEIDCFANFKIVVSRTSDHAYLHVKIQLQDELQESLWEVDAWDPRIIDVSLRSDGTIKNASKLQYGQHPKIIYSIASGDKSSMSNNKNVIDFPKPKAGRPEREATPESEMLEKHDDLYTDYSIARAIGKRLLPKAKSKKLGFLQKVSSWQKRKPSPRSSHASGSLANKR